MTQNYTPIIGMEVHVELNTPTKMFCRCPAKHFQVEPNTQVCPVCLGLPGALPVPNAAAIEATLKIGLALGCSVNLKSKFDRKHYFYPDLPKGYQISQYDEPLCYNGAVTLASGRKIRITRVHLEEDTGKLVHKTLGKESLTLVDFNRSGVPLVEIVTEPDLTSADEAKEYLKLIHSTVRFLGVSDADMEKGSMRLEANISVSADGSLPDYKVEVKNVNSFRYIAAAIDYEIDRHTQLLKTGVTPKQETRGWSLANRSTVAQRTKETARDYRYFPEPDIPRLEFTQKQIDTLRQTLPLLPSAVITQLTQAKVRLDYAQTAAENVQLAKYCLELAKMAPLEADNLIGQVINAKVDWQKVTPGELVAAVALQRQSEKLSQAETKSIVAEVIGQQPKVVADYKAGKTNAIQFLLGSVMARSKGAADPKIVLELLTAALAK